MLLRLKQLFDREGERKELGFEIPSCELGSIFGVGTFVTPVSLVGEIVNRAGVVSLSYSLSVTIHHLCDRCLDEFNREYKLDFSHILVRGETSMDEEEYVGCPEDTLDVNELAIQDLLLSLPTKSLYREDCRGLCPVCGQNLNHGDCDCEK